MDSVDHIRAAHGSLYFYHLSDKQNNCSIKKHILMISVRFTIWTEREITSAVPESLVVSSWLDQHAAERFKVSVVFWSFPLLFWNPYLSFPSVSCSSFPVMVCLVPDWFLLCDDLAPPSSGSPVLRRFGFPPGVRLRFCSARLKKPEPESDSLVLILGPSPPLRAGSGYVPMMHQWRTGLTAIDTSWRDVLRTQEVEI